MRASELRHGDVLIYNWGKNASLATQGIRIITGNKYTHCSVIQEVAGNKFVLEQLNERSHSFLPFYYAREGEEIRCLRPKLSPRLLIKLTSPEILMGISVLLMLS